jgi:hypothetical protein
MKLLIDLDGVCFDFAESLRRYLRSINSPFDYEKETLVWNFFYDWGMTLEQFLQACHDGADAGYVFVGPVRPGTGDALWGLRESGHEIHIATDRFFGTTPEVSQDHTRNWLAEHGIHYDSLTFTADKTTVEADAAIEDKIENYDALEKAGVKCWLVNRAWNQEDDDRRRCNSIFHFSQIIRSQTLAAFG